MSDRPESGHGGQSRRELPAGIVVLLFGLAYVACAELGSFLSFRPGRFEAFWPPSGLAVAVLILSPRRHWPFLLGAVGGANIAFNLAQGYAAAIVASYAVISTLEPLVGALLVQRFVARRPTLEKVPEVLGLAFYAGFLSTGLSAALGAAVNTLAFGGSFAVFAQAWWTANALGVLVVAPFILAWGSGGLAAIRGLSATRRAEVLILLLVTAAVSWVVISNQTTWGQGDVYLILPLLVAAAVRFGVYGAVTANLLASLVAIYASSLVAERFPPPPGVPTTEFGLAVQAFLAVAIFTTLLLAAVLAERGRAEAERAVALDEVARLADERQRRAAELRGILDNMVDAVFVCDASGRLTLINDAGLRLIGARDATEAMLHIADVVGLVNARDSAGRPLAVSGLPLSRALRGEMIVSDETVIANPSTGRDVVLRGSAAPIRDAAGEIIGAVTVARDVTGAVELDRLKDQFVGVAAHELKTPVAVMKGYAQVLRRGDEPLSPRQRKLLDAIVRGSDRIDRLIRDLLDLSRLQLRGLEIAREQFDVAELARDVAARQATLTSRHDIAVAAVEPATISGDRDRLEQVLTNLIDNAIRYSPAGGPIDVTVEADPASVTVAVRDRGVGIPAGKQRQIFERFFRAHTRTPYDYGGMGIGLFISREIVRKHGGEITFESVEGQGSTFHVRLPRASAEDVRVSDDQSHG